MRLTKSKLHPDFNYNVNVEETSPLTEKLIGLWLKHDPFIKIVAGDNHEIRRDAMLALLGENAAQRYMQRSKMTLPTPIVHPSHVRQKADEFLEDPQKRSRIIHQLVHWGSDTKINQENPDSHKTRMQIIHSLMGPLFLNSSPEQEKLIIEGLKVLVVTKTTSLGKTGEISPLVHHEILEKVSELLRYHYALITNQQKSHTEAIIRAHLLKSIQGLKETGHRSAYYVADDQARRKRLIAEKFPLKPDTYQGLLEIARHYTFSANTDFRRSSQKLLQDIKE